MAVLYGTKASLSVTAGGLTYPLDVVENDVQVSFDEGNSPFLTASAVINQPATQVMAALDPTKRNPVQMAIAYAPGATLNLSTFYTYERDYDPSANTVGLTLVTLEMLLQSYSPQSNVNLLAHQASVKTLTQTVLQQALGTVTTATLVGGATDRTFNVWSEAENLFPDPDVSGVGAYTGGGSNNAISKSTAGGLPAVRSQATTTVSRVDIAYPVTAPQVPVSPGQQYALSMAIRGTDGTSVQLFSQYINASGAVVVSYVKSLGTVSTSFSRVSMTTTAPSGASYLAWVLRNPNSSPSGTALEAAQIMVVAGDGTDPTAAAGNLHPYFSGNSSDTAAYHYSWAGDANASSSIRTPLMQRDPDNLYWTPGTSASDFLEPILEAVGLRLFLREDGTWCLANNGYRLTGQVAMQTGVNLYSGAEVVSIGDSDADGYPQNADAVILNYSWEDPVFGVQKTAVDKAVTAGYKRPYVADINKPYPGPGQAAYLLARLQARKASVSVSGRLDATARPGMTGFISLPNRPAYTGYVSRIDLDIASNTMQVTTKGLVTALPGSVGNAPITQTIGSVSGTIGAYTN